MRYRRSSLAREFARHIIKASSLREAPLNASPQEEQKDKAVLELIDKRLTEFLKRKGLSKDTAFDYEGSSQMPRKEGRNYDVVGIRTFPDAAVLSPFRCAFEFDREEEGGGSGFKDALMKVSVHVLSGRYRACVLFYVLRPGSSHKYLDDGSPHTERLMSELRRKGLEVALIRHAA